MMTDPILDELHAVRERMLADAGGTLAALAAKIEADQAKSGREIIKNADNHPNRDSDGVVFGNSPDQKS